MIWFTSDTHYNHAGIVRGTTSWENKKRTRDFDTLEEANKALVTAINSCAQEDDILYHIGDWSFGGFSSIKQFRDQLNVKEIHLILGNHDHHIDRNKEGIRGLFKSVSNYKEISVNGQFIVLCHYAMRVWNHSHKGSWMLYGHSHGTLDELRPEVANPTWIGDEYFIKNYKTMDVGVDTNIQMHPYSIDDIRKIMLTKEVLLGVDHHNNETT